MRGLHAMSSGKHEDDLRVGDAETLHGPIDRQDVGEVSVVEPEAGGRDEDGPVGGVGAEGREGEEEDEEEDEEGGCGQLHRCESANGSTMMFGMLPHFLSFLVAPSCCSRSGIHGLGFREERV